MAKFSVPRFLFRLSEERTLHGLETAVWPLSFGDERSRAFEKLDKALHVIQRHTPERYGALKSDVSSIFVSGDDPSIRGCFDPKSRMIVLELEYVIDPQTTPERVAYTLIHEAQHARLFRLGFGYDKTNWQRIERLCFRAQRIFAQKLFGGDALVAEADAWLDSDLNDGFSAEAVIHFRLKRLKDLGVSNWIVRILNWRMKRMISKSPTKH